LWVLKGFVASSFFAFFNVFAISVLLFRVARDYFLNGLVGVSFLAFFKRFAIAVLLSRCPLPLLQGQGLFQFLGLLQALCHGYSPLCESPRTNSYGDQFRESTCKWLANVREKTGGTHPPWNLADDDAGLAKASHSKLAKVLS